MFPQHICAMLAVVAALSASSAQAHIEYYDLNQGRQIRDLTAAGKAIAGNDIPLADPAHWSATYQTTMSSGETWTSLGGSFASGTWGYSVKVVNLDSAAWTDGLRSNPAGGAFLLGDTHKLQFANFHLDRSSSVTIRLQDDLVGSGYGVNPSFSLYRGLSVYQAHDDAVVDPLNPRSTTAPFDKIQNTKDVGNVVDSQGIISALRDTVGNVGTYAGQFNAQGGWSIANPAGDWTAVEYLASSTGITNPDGTWAGNANESSLIDYLLPAGDYMIAFGGNAQPVSFASARSGDAVGSLVATLSFNAVAAPTGSKLVRMLQRLDPDVLSSIAVVDGVGTPAVSFAPLSAVPEPRAWSAMLVGAAMFWMYFGSGRRRIGTYDDTRSAS